MGALRAAVVDVVVRHEVLRTTFPAIDGVPHQQIAPIDAVDGSLDWQVVESAADVEDSVTEGFDVAVQPPIRVRLWSAESGRDHTLAVVLHHIAADGESMGPLIADLTAAYVARSRGEEPLFVPLPVQLADVALWQQRELGDPDDPSSVVGNQLKYWRDQLNDLPDVLPLPTDRRRPAAASMRGAGFGFDVPAATVAAVRSAALASGTTDFMVLHAALAVLLSRLSATSDIAIGTPNAGRGQVELDPMVGMFVNTLVLRTHTDPAESFTDFLKRVRQVDLDAFAHADVPFEVVVDALSPARSEAFAPLTQVLLTFVADDQASDGEPIRLGELDIESVVGEDTSAKVDLTFTLSTDSGGGWAGHVNYATDLFDEGTVRAIADRLISMLHVLTSDTGRAVGDAPLVTKEEQQRLLPVGGALGARPRLLSDLLVEAAAQRPDHPAVVSGGQTMTYRELDAASNRLARQLLEHGASPEMLIAVAIPRSIDFMTVLWAVAKTGAAYVPVDPDYPAERVAAMVADSGARLGLTVAAAGELPSAAFQWWEIDDPAFSQQVRGRSAETLAASELHAAARIDNTAYVIYTSGSTGRPKGVSVTHSGLHNFAVEERDRADADGDSRVLGFASPSFDASALEYLLAFISGATLYYRPAGAIGGSDLQDFMREHRITHTFLTPTVLSSMEPGTMPDLRVVYVGGEAVPETLVDAWVPTVRVQNVYGPTETTIVAAISSPMRVGEPAISGPPLRGVAMQILDSRMLPVPAGVLGELYISGMALSRGYLDRPGLTAERFVADPNNRSGGRMYRTGDLARWVAQSDGDLAIAIGGRSDDQVKLRGLRIELGEIENVLAAHETVKSATVVGLLSDRVAGAGDSVVSALAAYVVPIDIDIDVDVDELRDHLSAALPDFMVPSSITTLAELPLTAVGKLDRRALPMPTRRITDEFVAPESQAEVMLESIVSGLLGTDHVSVTESFFALGGDSIMSIQLASAARAAGLTISPREIFERKTIRGIAAAAAAAASEQAPLLEEAEGGASGTFAPTPVMSWMVELSEAADDFADFSQSMVLNAPAEISVDALGSMLGAVSTAHPILASRFVEVDGQWVVESGVRPVGAADVTSLQSDHGTGDPEFAEDLRVAFTSASARLNPAAGAMVQAVVVVAADGLKRIVLVIHHLVIDAVSWRVVIEDLMTAWSQLRAGLPFALRKELTSMRSWALALRANASTWEHQIDYWLARLPEASTALGADIDRRRDLAATVTTIVENVPAEITEATLTRVPEAFRGAVNDPLLAALARAVRAWQHDRGIVDDAGPISILLEGHGRYEDALAGAPEGGGRADLSRTVGWFTTIAPVAVDPSADVTRSVKSAKEARISQPDNGLAFGQLRYSVDTELSGRPLPSIGFNYLGNVTGSEDSDGDFLPASGAPVLPGSVSGAMVATNALAVNIATVRGEGGLRSFAAEFGFPRAMFAESDIADLAGRFTAELRSIVEFVDSGVDPGLSPSDIPGVRLSQDDIDDLAVRYPGAAVWPLSPLQRGFVFQSEIAVGATEGIDVYVAQVALRLDGHVDVSRLEAAIAQLPVHHRVLRSGFVHAASGAVVAVVPDEVTVPCEVVDMRGADDDAVARFVSERAGDERLKPFDLASPPLMRFVIVRTDAGVRLLVTSHHILIDGWSSPLLIADLLALYEVGTTYTSQVGTSDKDFGDFVAGLSPADDPAGLAAWQRVVAPLNEATLVAGATEATVDVQPVDHNVVLDAELTAEIERAARTAGCTVSTVMQFAWAVLLSRLTGSQVVAFGETVSGRPADLDGVDSMIGLFINTLPAVVDVDPDLSIGETLRRMQETRVSVLDHQHVGLPEITALTELPALFDTLVVHESYPVDTESLSSSQIALSVADVDAHDATHYPLGMSTSPFGDGLQLTIKYLPSAFDGGQVEVFAGVVGEVLRAVVRDAGVLVGDVALAGV
ncbi:non-ribosomal peptide synthetase, partial [Gordonia sp. (in: high G+C Gram-positive bacteria)]|uniref:non-ribosomal peptide synthetase n=1 Tax=Gordonia sp. (in: high G+C Gram-positive bacteria) TaxID=84139 RepID=UPI0025BE544D